MKDYFVLNPALDALAKEHCIALYVGRDHERFAEDFIRHHGECVVKAKGLDRSIRPLALEYPPAGSPVCDFELFFDSPVSASRLAAFEGLFFIDLSLYAGADGERELRMLKDYIACEQSVSFVIAVSGADRATALKVFERVASCPVAELVAVDTVSLKSDIRKRKGSLTANDEELIDTLSGVAAEKSAIESIISAVTQKEAVR